MSKDISIIRRAAESGNINSAVELANMYYFGDDIEQDYTEAAKWFEIAANAGNIYAEAFMGNIYYGGKGVERNYCTAARYYKLAADKGDSFAQRNLGECYFYGRGVEQNYSEAIRLYKLSAEQGDSFAQLSLADCYYEGKGVEKNTAEAIKLYMLSADQDNSFAKEKLERIKNPVSTHSTTAGLDMQFDQQEIASPIPEPWQPPQPILAEKTIYYDWRTGEPLYYDNNGNIVNSQGEEVAACWWD